MATLSPSRLIRPLSVLAAVLVVGYATGRTTPSSAAPRAQAVKPDAERAAHMRMHFTHVMSVHEAVIRGDLPAVKSPATWLAEHEGPESLPARSAPHMAAMRRAAGRAANAETILAAASATALMLKTCGDCHRAAGTMPAAPVPPRPDVGGIVGHMLQHQEAADLMLQGLVVPSSSLWRAGAEALKGAALHASNLPPDAQLTRRLIASEERIHQLADQALRVEDRGARAVFYAQILARCADCHALHREVWGPSRR